MRLKHKYSAVAVERDGFRFDSRKEGRRYDELILLQRAGDVVMFLHQVPFRMPGTKYVADFLVFWKDGSVTVEDCKGYLTETYKLKKRLMAVNFPAVEIIEI